MTTPVAGNETTAVERWLVLYDAECGLCKWLLAGFLRWDAARVLEPVALQSELAERLLADLTQEQRMASWHLVAPGGARTSGGQAVAPMLTLLPGGRPAGAVAGRIPWLMDRGYRWVAANRSALSRLVPAEFKRAGAALVSEREREQAARSRLPSSG